MVGREKHTFEVGKIGWEGESDGMWISKLNSKYPQYMGQKLMVH